MSDCPMEGRNADMSTMIGRTGRQVNASGNYFLGVPGVPRSRQSSSSWGLLSRIQQCPVVVSVRIRSG